tara:strand:+ start:3600 stop:4817 length:1218 start_codon:yes stop_codon:yes gene_type:complete
MIVFVVLSLSAPRSVLSTKVIQVDNYPSKWTARDLWLPGLIENLEDGFYQLYDRQGTYLGTSEKAAVFALFDNISSTLAPLVPVSDALLLSYGFDEAIYSPAWIPTRQIQLSTPITMEANALGELFFQWDGLGVVNLKKDGKVADNRIDSTYRISLEELTKGQNIVLDIAHDSIPEDDLFFWGSNSKGRRLVLINDLQYPVNEFINEEDTVLNYASDLVLDYTRFNAVVLIGFDFIPPALDDFTGKLVQFSKGTQNQKNSISIPELKHPFYSSFFIGPSLQNAWPEAHHYDAIELEKGAMLRVNGTVVAVMNNGAYRQGFMPKDWLHPYYRAINQWSLGSRQQLEYVPFLGLDFYQTHVNNNGVKVIDHQESQYAQGFRANLLNEKLYLLLALLCALIALIFVKI